MQALRLGHLGADGPHQFAAEAGDMLVVNAGRKRATLQADGALRGEAPEAAAR
jgi:hypothetical protein